MKGRLLFLLLLNTVFLSCSGQQQDQDSVSLKIKRFDVSLYNYLNQSENREQLNEDPFLNLFGEQVLHIGGVDSIGFYDRLNAFFSEPTLMSLYKDEQVAFRDITDIESELSGAFSLLFSEFPHLIRPEVYMHVSGLNQNIIVTDDILSVSVDKYLGEDYPLYENYFYDYQRKQMKPDRIVPDYLLGFMMANFPFNGNRDVLLDHIIYEGKLRYLLSRMLPARQEWEFVGYDEGQYAWCMDNASRIWGSILENKHLYLADYQTTSRYIRDAPHTAFMPLESPGRVGVWVGYQIVVSYMKNRPDTSLAELMVGSDAQQFLKESKYKP